MTQPFLPGSWPPASSASRAFPLFSWAHLLSPGKPDLTSVVLLPSFLPRVLCQSHGVILHLPVTSQPLTHLPASSPAMSPTTPPPTILAFQTFRQPGPVPNLPHSLQHGLSLCLEDPSLVVRAWQKPPELCSSVTASGNQLTLFL